MIVISLDEKNALITHFACNKTLRVKTYRKLYASLTWGVPEVPRISPTDPPPKSCPPHRELKRLSSDFASTRRSGTETVTLSMVAFVPREEKHPSLGILMMLPSYYLSLLTNEKEEQIKRTTTNKTAALSALFRSSLSLSRKRERTTKRNKSFIILKTFYFPQTRTKEEKGRKKEEKLFRV